MLTRSAKQAFYVAAGPLMRINGWVYRTFRAPTNTHDRVLRLHLGPGQKAYLPGWINVDANMFTGKCDVWADLRNPLPFRNGTIDAAYSHHVIEHLPDLEAHFREVHRVLKRGGVYRVGGPNGDAAIHKFMTGDSKWFSDWPDCYDSIGGRFVNFVFCRNEHLTMLTESFLREVAQRAGFVVAEKLLPVKETRSPDLFSDCLAKEDEQDFDTPHTIIMEFRK
jgi:predicted SAM-dependent methyltransferase